ncbi:MAG: signal peptidase I [Clostridium sp.]|nr:signal peptidase I [Clostridium sp.]
MENKEKHLGSVRRDESPKSRKRDEEKEPFSWKKEILSWIQILAVAAVIAYVLTTYIIANSTVPTGSMENTIMSHSRVLGSRLTYKFSEPERGDIAIFRYPDDKEEGITTYYVKRIIGLPGETVDIVDGKIYINGSDTPLDEPYLHEEMDMYGKDHLHYSVPEGHYFMLGDNRNNSNDARFWKNKYVPEEDLIAKVYLEYFPNPHFLH